MLALPIWALVAALTGPTLSYRLAGLAEARTESGSRAGLQVTPLAELDGQLKAWRLSLGYRPRALLETGGSPLRVLHRAALGLEGRPFAGTRVTALQELARGQTDFSWISAAADGGVPSLDRPQRSRPLAFQQSQSSVLLDQALSRALQLQLQGSFDSSGGADSQARLTAPLLRVWSGGALLSVRASRSESFGLSLRGSSSSFSDQAQRGRTLDAGLQWKHRFSPPLQLLAGIGLGLTRSSNARSEPVDSAVPTFVLSLTYAKAGGGRHPKLSLEVRSVPFVSPTDGSVRFRPEARADARTFLKNKVFVRLAAAVSPVTTAGDSRSLAWGFSSATGFEAASGAVLSLGVRMARQPDLVWAVFAALDVARLGKF